DQPVYRQPPHVGRSKAGMGVGKRRSGHGTTGEHRHPALFGPRRRRDDAGLSAGPKPNRPHQLHIKRLSNAADLSLVASDSRHAITEFAFAETRSLTDEAFARWVMVNRS